MILLATSDSEAKLASGLSNTMSRGVVKRAMGITEAHVAPRPDARAPFRSAGFSSELGLQGGVSSHHGKLTGGGLVHQLQN